MSDHDFFDRDIDDYGQSDAAADNEAPLSWRLDGDDSLSDWTIVVTRKEEEEEEEEEGARPPSPAVYRVHRAILGVGPRKSEYFSSLFRSENPALLAESSTSTSEVELEDTAAEAFPAMLDYMYSAEGRLPDLTADNAVALRHLARYFRIRGLFDLATEFIRGDMVSYGRDSEAAAAVYLPEAYKYRDERMIDAAVRVCAEDIGGAAAEYIGDYSPELFRRVLLSEDLNNSGYFVSSVVADFFSKSHRAKDDERLLELFDTVTDEKVMPEVDPFFTAFKLLEWDAACQLSNPARSSSLRSRCMDAITFEWRNTMGIPLDAEANGNDETTIHLPGNSYRRATVGHRDLDPSVQIELLERSLRMALADIEKKDDEIARLRGRHSMAASTSSEVLPQAVAW